ncbi:MAG: S41 family peptidase [Acidobacteriota bacterium]
MRLRTASRLLLLTVLSLLLSPPAGAQGGRKGYYRHPSLHGSTIVFAAEGDLWVVGAEGGVAQRLTSHEGSESNPAISPDGTRVAFTASYDGPREVYVMPLDGGTPQRLTWENDPSTVVGWTPAGEVLFSTRRYSTLPSPQLVAVDLESGALRRIPLSQAGDGSYSADGQRLVFTRPGFHRNNTRRYQGGTARNLWRFDEGADEAVNLTADFPGEDHSPMVAGDRVIWVNDRSGMMNLWSMPLDGGERQQHTDHTEWDVKSPALDASGNSTRIVYRLGADLRLFDAASGDDRALDITLRSDFDLRAERWEDEPMSRMTSMNLDETGERVVLTTRGRVFVFPAKSGRRLQIDRQPGVRYRDAAFLDEDNVLLLSDATREVEFYSVPANGQGERRQITNGGQILRFGGIASPDGSKIAFSDKNNDLRVAFVESGDETVLSQGREGIASFEWSPDGRYLAFSEAAPNTYFQVFIADLESGDLFEVTSDRTNSYSPSWSPDGEWLYLLSDRNLRSLVGSPWGPRQPEPYFDQPMEIYQVGLAADSRPTFWPEDELTREAEQAEKAAKKDDAEAKEEESDEDDSVTIDPEGLSSRIWKLPVSSGNYFGLSAVHDAVVYLSRGSGPGASTDLLGLATKPDSEPVTIVSGVRGFQHSGDRKKALVRTGSALHVVDAAPKKADPGKTRVDLSGWRFPVSLAEDYEQIFVDAWRLERDYFYDPGMHGLDWEAVLEKYQALLSRVTTRDELSDLIGEVVAELSALHVSVRGGDFPELEDNINVANLGARLVRDPGAGGYVIEHIYRADADYPEWRGPLSDPYHRIENGDVLVAINGTSLLDVRSPGELLRNQAGQPVRLTVRDAGASESRDVLVTPQANESNLRYHDWQYSRRLEVEDLGDSRIGYVHLRAMGSSNLSEWYRNFYPVFDRQGLIIDARHNRGGNIDSIILEKLMRRAWFYWKGRVGIPTWNMQYAFRGHMVVLVDENTASDGEAFAEGFRRLGLGPVIGTRTWGGEIWLSSNNRLTDGGIARAPQTGVYGPEREWLIEGWGVEPDIVVDNLPHETFNGRDRQLEAAVEHLLQKIAEDPREVPEPPPYPDKSWKP